MTSYKFSVIIPVIYLTDYSREAIKYISNKVDNYQQILFILSCTESVVNELHSVFNEKGAKKNVIISPSKINGSNHLRYHGLQYVNTDYVYYQDCDDKVDYQALLDSWEFCTGNNVVCFNIRRRQFDKRGNVVDDRLLYPQTNYEVNNIGRLMTNIVNKLIPQKYLKELCFYNIPFSQDLSLSFQLFEKGPHLYCSKCTYLYENNYKSMAGLNRTTRESLLRVVAIERILMKLIFNKNNRAYVKYRYEIIIQGRFAYLKECYWPSFSPRVVCPFIFGLRGATKNIYHYFITYLSCVRIFIHKLKSSFHQ